MKTEELRYDADGLKMIGHLAYDESRSGKRPGVLVFPEAFGLGPHAIEIAERLVSERGYVALGCDLHGERGMLSGMDQLGAALGPLMSDASRVRARTVKALEALRARPEVDPARIAAIGFCFGGTMSFELALSGADIRAAIGFHSGLGVTSPGDAGNIKGKVLALLGADDPLITPDSRNTFEAMMRQGGVDWQMTLYGGVVHSFTNKEADKAGAPDALRYDEKADRRSWKAMCDLFDEVMA